MRNRSYNEDWSYARKKAHFLFSCQHLCICICMYVRPGNTHRVSWDSSGPLTYPEALVKRNVKKLFQPGVKSMSCIRFIRLFILDFFLFIYLLIFLFFHSLHFRHTKYRTSHKLRRRKWAVAELSGSSLTVKL